VTVWAERPRLHTTLVVEGGECGAVPSENEPDVHMLAAPIATLPEAAALARYANPRVTATKYAGLSDPARARLGAKLAEAFGA
jgi:hypothetical protein